jgi:predicted RNA-binding protein YlxR (DUF448 family)
MSTATIIAREDQTDKVPEGARRCIVTGEVKPKDALIRFAISPDNIVVPDVAGNLPGRGLWVTAWREAIDTAQQKNLFAKAAKAPVKAASGLADSVAQLLRKRCLDLLGLAKGAGIAVLGQTQVEAAIKAKKLGLLLIADDASAGGLGKIDTTAVETLRSFTRQELGSTLGYEQVVYAGLLPHGLTGKLKQELVRLQRMTNDSPNTDKSM